MPTNIQSKHSQHNFDSVAHAIGAALKAYPKAVRIQTGGLAPETYARKFREAVEAKRLYDWPTKYFTAQDFAEKIGFIGTSIQTDSAGNAVLFLGPKEALKNISVIEQGQAAVEDHLSSHSFVADLDGFDGPFTAAFCLLVASNRLTPLPPFFVTGLTPSDIETLENRWPIGFVPVEGHENTWQIIT